MEWGGGDRLGKKLKVCVFERGRRGKGCHGQGMDVDIQKKGEVDQDHHTVSHLPD